MCAREEGGREGKKNMDNQFRIERQDPITAASTGKFPLDFLGSDYVEVWVQAWLTSDVK